eukprot:gene34175-biopygen18261
MPFGAAGATAAFIRIMDYELRAFTHCTVAYVDDVVIYSDTAEQHLKDVEAVLRTLGDAGIWLHSGKSTFEAATADFLGYRIGYNTTGAQDIKCKAIQELPKPEDKTGVRSILGLMNYYKGLVGEPMGPNYSEMARPLNDLLKKEVVNINGYYPEEAREAGVVCYEPCGGLCAGLEMLLRFGVKVKKCLYQDISTASQAVARTRCLALSRRHPDLFPAAAIQLEQLPSNLEDTRLKDLVRAGALSGDRWVMVCGYPCQDLSPAGKLAGLEGKHSRLFYRAVRVLSILQQVQPRRPPAYVLENVSPLSHREHTKIRKEVFPIINSVVGQPVSFDAARAGSYAHRLRAYWSNLFQNHQFNLIMKKVTRPPDRYVSNILQQGWKPRKVVSGDRKPHHIANVVGEPVRVLSTILATQNSRAFRAPRAGTVVRADDVTEEGESREINLDEKAIAMGYSAGELRMTGGMSDEELAGILGLAMDRRAMELLFAVAKDLLRHVSPEMAPEPAQAQLAEWVTRSNDYTKQVAQRLSHQDWEQRLQQMRNQGQKGTQGVGTANTVQRRRQWKLASMGAEDYKTRHRQTFANKGWERTRGD